MNFLRKFDGDEKLNQEVVKMNNRYIVAFPTVDLFNGHLTHFLIYYFGLNLVEMITKFHEKNQPFTSKRGEFVLCFKEGHPKERCPV